MAFVAPDYEDCGEKCRCLTGINKGVVYNRADPCGEAGTFNQGECTCDNELDCGEWFELQGQEGQFNDTYLTNAIDGEFLEFAYEAFNLPDKFEVMGDATFSTGTLISGGETVLLPLRAPGRVTVKVTASEEGTRWNYRLRRACRVGETPGDGGGNA